MSDIENTPEETGETEQPVRKLTAAELKQERRMMRSAARLVATQALFQMEARNQGAPSVLREYEDHHIGMKVDGDEYREADIELLRTIVGGVVQRQAEIDQATDKALVARWPIAKLDPTLRALFRAAGSELINATQTPPKVCITEFVDVAKAFYPEGKESRFVNAVLDHMARELRPEAFK